MNYNIARTAGYAIVVCVLVLVSFTTAADNVHVINDPQDIPFGGTDPVGPNPSGYDLSAITFTLDANDTLTIEMVPFGTPGDADGDGNADSSSNPSIPDDPGVGPTELLQIGFACQDPASCTPDANFIYTNNTLNVMPNVGAASLTVSPTAYVLTIPNFTDFKAGLGGVPSDFAAFSFSASFLDQSVDDLVPDQLGSCEPISLTPPVVNKDPFDCYAVNRVKVKDKPGTDHDVVKVSKGGFRLDSPNTVDLSTDMVQIRIDGLSFDFPPGSFQQKGNKPDYVFKSASGAVPKIKARLRFEKAVWSIRVKGADAGLVDNSDGVDVSLMIGGFESTENITLNNKGKYIAYPKKSCRHVTSDSSDDGVPGLDKLSCLSSLTLKHTPSGRLITKNSVTAGLVHPQTVFSDDTTGDIAIVHTSCSQCLQCGDVIGNFAIMEIQGLPGNTMCGVCGVPDASCSLFSEDDEDPDDND